MKPHEPGRFTRNDQGVVSTRKEVIKHMEAVTERDVGYLTKVDLVQKPNRSYHVIAQAAAALEGRFVEMLPSSTALTNKKARL